MVKKLWEILVPTTYHDKDGKEFIWARTHHQYWDSRVSEIAGGLTILRCSKGRWLDSKGKMLQERMVQVRIVATEDEMGKIADMTADHYRQDAVMYYLISERAVIKNYV